MLSRRYVTARRVWDFRSDTATTPTPEMLQRMLTSEVGVASYCLTQLCIAAYEGRAESCLTDACRWVTMFLAKTPL